MSSFSLIHEVCQKHLTLNTKIWISVTLIHLLSLAFLSSSAFSMKPQPKRMVVITKQLAPPPVVVSTPIVSTPVVKQALPSHPLKKPQPVVKKTKPLPAKKQVKSSKQVLKKLDQRLTKSHTPIPVAPTPTPALIDSTPSYIDCACSLFRELLVLPEKGIVKLTITVQANGKIGTVKIETFESKNNLDYLMTMLPTLSLPIPEGGKDATFTVLFCNDHLTL